MNKSGIFRVTHNYNVINIPLAIATKTSIINCRILLAWNVLLAALSVHTTSKPAAQYSENIPSSLFRSKYNHLPAPIACILLISTMVYGMVKMVSCCWWTIIKNSGHEPLNIKSWKETVNYKLKKPVAATLGPIFLTLIWTWNFNKQQPFPL